MANISDVYDIDFEVQSEPMAEALLAYFKAIEAKNPYYETTNDIERDGLVLKSMSGVMGRWVYSNNLEGSFERPAEWFGDIFPADEWQAVLDLLKSGEEIHVSYSEDEGGCEVHQDGSGTISWYKEGEAVTVSLDFEEHDPPCDIVEAEDSGEENPDEKDYWCYGHNQFTNDPDRCEAGM